jgi:hypothetical protein
MRLDRIHKIRICIIVLSIVLPLLILMSNGEKDGIMIIGVIIIAGVMLIATTRAFQIFQIFGFILAFLFISSLLFEVTISTLRRNCIIVWCSNYTSPNGQLINKYAEFIRTLYPEESWSDQFSFELATLIHRVDKSQYYPYIGYRRTPYDGEYAYINEEGLRPVPQSECNQNSFTVYTMGNSAMWGQYEPNHLTLAALIQEELASSISQPVCLINYAQGAWNSTQSVIQLLNLIQMGERPDLVIFFNGAVDIIASAQYRKTNTPLLSPSMARAFGEIDKDLLSEEHGYLWFKQTEIGSIFLDIFQQTGKQSMPGIPVNLASYLDNYRYKLNQDSMLYPEDVYIENYGIVSAFADTYDFKFAVFTQPVSFYGGKLLTAKEKTNIKDGWLSDPRYAELFEQTYPKLSTASEQYEHMYFLGHIFDGETQEIYGDPVHPLPDANRVIAQFIGDILVTNYLK